MPKRRHPLAGHLLPRERTATIRPSTGDAFWLGGVSPSELRDRIIFFIRQYGPRIMFIPNPYTHNDGHMDNYYVGSATEEEHWAAGLANFQPPHGLVVLHHAGGHESYILLPFTP